MLNTTITAAARKSLSAALRFERRCQDSEALEAAYEAGQALYAAGQAVDLVWELVLEVRGSSLVWASLVDGWYDAKDQAS